MNCKNKAVRAVLVLLMTLTVICLCPIAASADTAAEQSNDTDSTTTDTTTDTANYPRADLDGGYYTIKNKALGTYLSFDASAASDDNVSGLSHKSEIGADTLFELLPTDAGTYRLRVADRGSALYVAYDTKTGNVGLCGEDIPTQSGILFDFVLCSADGMYFISPNTLTDTELALSAVTGEGGVSTLLFSQRGDGSTCWAVDEVRADSLSISLYHITTTPYTTYTDLRAVVSPSYLSACVEWSSSDKSVLIVDDDGKFCTLSEGSATVTAKLGSKEAECEINVSYDNEYAWYSQNNVTTGGWNGGALYNIYFRSGGVKKRFALNNSTKSSDWISEGCALCSIAQVLNNMGARYTKGYDFRSGTDGNIIADPYTVALANTNNRGAESAKAVLSGDPIFTSQRAIASRFNVNGAEVTVDISYRVTKKTIKEALDKCPWGVVVCFENSAYGKHYITFNKCLNPDAKDPDDYIFTVSDPASVNAYNAANVIFEECYSYTRLYYRFRHATLMQVWSYEQ